MADPQTPPRHRTFPVFPAPELRHSDECIANVRRYGFCEHTMLPRPRPRPSWRKRHPHWAEVIAIALFGGLIGCYVIVAMQMGWWGMLVYSVSGIFWLAVLVWGLPRFMTDDPSKWLPPDARDRLDR